MTHTKIVLSGMQSISALGADRETMNSRMTDANPSICTVKKFEYHELDRELPCYRVDGFEPADVLGKKGMRTRDWPTKLLMAAIERGFKPLFDSLTPEQFPGLCIGTAFGSVQSIGDFLSESLVNGVSAVNPMLFGNTVINSPTGNANIRFNIKELSATVATGFNAGLDAIIYAADYIKSGYAQSLIAGGFDEVSYYGLLGLDRSGVLSSLARARPFALDADGYVMGDACAVCLVESEENAKLRGSTVIAEVAGTGAAFDANGFSGSSAGAESAVKAALDMAGIGPERISFIAASAGGSRAGDAMEAAMIRTLFPGTPVAAYKALIGECYGASGAMLVACAVADASQKRISGTGTSYKTLADINVVQNTTAKVSDYVLINSFSCDGNCSAMVLKTAT